MTTPTTQPTPAQQAAEQFREEIRELLADIMHELAQVKGEVAQMRQGLTHAAQPAPITNSGQFTEMVIDNIIMTYSDKGEPAYKAIGQPYNKFGVRVWPETLPIIGIDPTFLKPGPNPQPEQRVVKVLMQINDEGKASPRKVTGKA